MRTQEANNNSKLGLNMKVLMVIQMIIIVMAFAMTIIGIQKTMDDYRLLTVFCAQAITCASMIIYIIFNIKRRDTIYFKAVIYAYAVLTVLRAALLESANKPEWAEILSRLILVTLTVHCVVFIEYINDVKRVRQVSLIMIFWEVLMYVIFLVTSIGTVGSPMMYLLPLVAVFMAASLWLLNEVRLYYLKQ